MIQNLGGKGFWNSVLLGAIAYVYVLIVAVLAGLAFNVFLTAAGF